MKKINDGLTTSQRFYRKHKAALLKRNYAWRDDNPDKVRQYRRDWYQRHKTTIRINARIKAGCIDPTGDDKSGLCPICLREVRLVYDHCHSSGHHRGWVCTSCNLRLGWFERNRAAIINYLSDTSRATH